MGEPVFNKNYPEFAAQKPADPIELRIYPGANGSFTLYEDENDSYNYEHGAYSTIRFSWDDASHSLSIGERSGSFPGMLTTRSFRIVFVRENHGTGGDFTSSPDKTVQYSGKEIRVSY